MEFLGSSSAVARQETGMTLWTHTLLIPKADTYFLGEIGPFFFLHDFISACFPRPSWTCFDNTAVQPQIWEYLQCAWPKIRLAVTEFLRSADLSFGLCSVFLEEIFCICLSGWNNTTQDRSCFGCRSFFPDKKLFFVSLNPCHSPSCRSLGVVFLQKAKTQIPE